MSNIFKRTVKRVQACCRFGEAGLSTDTFIYEGSNESEVVVEHPLNRVPYVYVVEVDGEGNEFRVEATINVSIETPFDVTVEMDPVLENFIIVLN
jgi:hypothetical protein